MELIEENYELTQMDTSDNYTKRMSIECNPDDTIIYELSDDSNNADDESEYMGDTIDIIDTNIIEQIKFLQVTNYNQVTINKIDFTP